MDEFGAGNKTIYVVFDEESEFSGPRRPTLRPDQVVGKHVPYKNLKIACLNMLFLLISLFLIRSVGYVCLKMLSSWYRIDKRKT